jgi:hypothetical protein
VVELVAVVWEDWAVVLVVGAVAVLGLVPDGFALPPQPPRISATTTIAFRTAWTLLASRREAVHGLSAEDSRAAA